MSTVILLLYGVLAIPSWVFALRDIYFEEERAGKPPQKASIAGWAVLFAAIWPLLACAYIGDFVIDFALRNPPKDIVELRNQKTEKELGIGDLESHG